MLRIALAAIALLRTHIYIAALRESNYDSSRRLAATSCTEAHRNALLKTTNPSQRSSSRGYSEMASSPLEIFDDDDDEPENFFVQRSTYTVVKSTWQGRNNLTKLRPRTTIAA